MEIKEKKKLKKNLLRFICETCDFKCYMKCDWDRHILRPKHLNSQDGNHWKEKNLKKTYFCQNCAKQFVTQSGLWKHKKVCTIEPITHTETNTDIEEDEDTNKKTKELINYLMKENSEFKQLLIDQNKQMLSISSNAIQNAGHSHNTINSHNKTFNLQVFLNETCKNAINLTDFVNQLQVSVKDLEETGRLGFSEGISKIFINGLKQMDIPDRPLHCSDIKRETIYIKDNDQWLKETDEKPLLINAIKNVSSKNMKQISEWTKVNSEYNDSSSKQNDKYLKILCESMSGSTKEESDKNYEKIVKKIVKETVIDKSII
jgi:hypothetical protein